MEDKLADILKELEIEMASLDKECSDEETKYNKLEEVQKSLKEAYNDLTEIK